MLEVGDALLCQHVLALEHVAAALAAPPSDDPVASACESNVPERLAAEIRRPLLAAVAEDAIAAALATSGASQASGDSRP
jgi:hypothetical protein